MTWLEIALLTTWLLVIGLVFYCAWLHSELTGAQSAFAALAEFSEHQRKALQEAIQRLNRPPVYARPLDITDERVPTRCMALPAGRRAC
jgi:hypothetical protein